MGLLVTFRPYKFQQGIPADSLPSWAYDWSKKGLNTFDKYDAARGTSQRVTITPDMDTKFKLVLTMKGISIGHVSIVKKRFSATVTELGLEKGLIVEGSLRAVSEPLSEQKRQTLTHNINLAYQRLGIDFPEADLSSLFSHRSLPFASFWCWWVHWVASLIQIISDAEAQHQNRTSLDNNIAELLFRELPRELDSIPNIRQFGTRAGLLALVDYQRWSNIFLSREHEYNSAAARDSEAVFFADALFRSAWGMRPAVLDTGRVGYVPEDTKAGDQVVIFYGVKAPLVIRRTEKDMYRIVGPAHVCGVMYGRVVDAEVSGEAFKLV